MKNKININFLKDLTSCISPSGYENEAAVLWKNYTKKFSRRVQVDVHGNIIASLGKSEFKVMFCGHIDEIGYMVKYIDEQGYIYFSTIGGIDAGLIGGREVVIKTEKGHLSGVIGKKPIHLIRKEEAAKQPKAEDFWIDIGAKNKKEAQKLVKVGDVAVPAVQFVKLQNNFVAAKSFDDKTGAFIVAEVLRNIASKKPPIEVYGVATVQEEIGLRGARTSAFGISPNVGIAIDVTFATDHPTVEKKRIGEISLGKGPVLAKGPNINPKVFSLLESIAKKKKIPYQIEAISSATGTDANVIQLTKSGVATGLVSIPSRYMHTPVEVVSISDLENTIKLLSEFLLNLKKRQDFIPF